MAKNILLVEDDTYICEMYTHVFEKYGYQIIVAEDGNQGLALAQQQQFDLILLDIMMPKKTGIDVLKELRTSDSDHKNTPVILLTNLGQQSIVEEAMTLGANGYLLKAELLPNEVMQKVEGYLNNSISQAELQYQT
jgi:DNA-binding response OmpR family regulator